MHISWSDVFPPRLVRFKPDPRGMSLSSADPSATNPTIAKIISTRTVRRAIGEQIIADFRSCKKVTGAGLWWFTPRPWARAIAAIPRRARRPTARSGPYTASTRCLSAVAALMIRYFIGRGTSGRGVPKLGMAQGVRRKVAERPTIMSPHFEHSLSFTARFPGDESMSLAITGRGHEPHACLKSPVFRGAPLLGRNPTVCVPLYLQRTRISVFKAILGISRWGSPTVSWASPSS
ncbi:hypothetical protein DFH08DRAFT_942288 [Mycena albidolilacea]|uniref:Uncharacterized protein n=1 Tax=Mycena albidolilacea TaxID=1033008 RepID=A0AAD6ZF85_9AGAR|nr:hypothetical protein DFH08DRAFT_942288 [Mycena albidolilacea]